jgi:GNAT superfamily N-acetyltransferase
MLIRHFVPEDIPLVVQLHLDVHCTEHGFDASFRSYVEDAMMDFLASHDPDREYLWIVEDNGITRGSIAIVKVSEEIAQLRWFILGEELRGQGIGRTLLEHVIDYCKEKNYKSILLWTVDFLDTARHLYEEYGFMITETATHHAWGKYLVEERWDLNLDGMPKGRDGDV